MERPLTIVWYSFSHDYLFVCFFWINLEHFFYIEIFQ
jgi:hypothetical protein